MRKRLPTDVGGRIAILCIVRAAAHRGEQQGVSSLRVSRGSRSVYYGVTEQRNTGKGVRDRVNTPLFVGVVAVLRGRAVDHRPEAHIDGGAVGGQIDGGLVKDSCPMLTRSWPPNVVPTHRKYPLTPVQGSR